MDTFYHMFEAETGLRITGEDEYRDRFPEAMEAIEKAFNHKHSSAKKIDYKFAGLRRSDDENAHHRVIYEPIAKYQKGVRISRLAFDLYAEHEVREVRREGGSVTLERADWWRVEPPSAAKVGGRSGP